jgi:hypothetical protein
MGKRQWIKPDRAADYRRFVAQKALIEKWFPCFRCRLSRRTLECIGEIVPSDDCATYRIRIQYEQGSIPKVWIEDPPIKPSPRIHMYGDGSLCLYFWHEQPWKSSDDIHKKIIPWIAEWLVFYELHLITGEWLGPAAPHDSAPKTEQPDVQ